MNKELLMDLIKFETVFDNHLAFEDCFSYIKNYFKKTNLIVKEYSFEGKKSLVITNCDTLEFDCFFVGHIDVVPGKKEQFLPFIKDNRMYGRGAFDMKGHVSVMMEVMKNLPKTNYKVALFITSDEEHGGFLGVKRLLNEIGYYTNLAIVPDAGNDFALVIEEKGVLQLKLSYQGKSAHASSLWEGDNALSYLIGIYQDLVRKYPLPKGENDYVTGINLAILKGGDAINKVCDYASMILDIRYTSKDKKEAIINYIKKTNPKVMLDILAVGDEFKYFENDLSLKYLDVCEQVLGRKVKKIKCASSSDGRFFSQKGISCILMNAKGGNLHSDNEYINLDSLANLYQIYCMFLENTNDIIN